MARAVKPAGPQATSDCGTARRLQEAAVTEFARQGYDASSTRDIAARIGLSAAAMYPHYRSKEELLYVISLDGHRSALHALRAADPTAAPPPERLRAVVAAFAQWQAEHNALARVVQYEIRSLSPGHYREILLLRRDTMGVLQEILEAGCVTGDFEIQTIDGVLLAISSLCVDICRWFPSGTFHDARQLGKFYGELAAKIVGCGSPS